MGHSKTFVRSILIFTLLLESNLRYRVYSIVYGSNLIFLTYKSEGNVNVILRSWVVKLKIIKFDLLKNI